MPNPDRFRTPGSSTPPPVPPFMMGVRRRSDYEYLGLPLWCIAVGPDLAKGEIRGHAKGIVAIGDIATGVIAIGGLARGGFAIGGLAIGLVAFGGFALGGIAFGGLAIGLAALGGGAIGWVAMGGAAVGVYAAGGAAWGKYVLSAVERSPEAIEFFLQWDTLRALLPPAPPRR